jgi:outer membrane protein TolC
MTFRKILLSFICLSNFVFAQYNLNYFIDKAMNNSPVIKDYGNLFLINNLQGKLDEAQNSAFQVYLSSNVLFAPYFNNNGTLFTPNPSPNAIGYDAAVTNGGLYSAQINFDKNIFNGGFLDALKEQRAVQGESYENKTTMEKHDLRKQITDQYLTTLQYLMLYNLSKEVENNLSDQLKITSDLVSKGYAKAQDYLLLKVEYTTQQINLNEERQNYKNSLMQLYALCGIKDTSVIKIDSVDLVPKEVKEGRSNFLTKYYLDSLNTAYQQDLFETKYQPQVGLFFNAGLNAVELDNIQRKFGISAGINFSLPLLDGGQKDITRQQSTIAERTLGDYKSYLSHNIFIQRKNTNEKISTLKNNLTEMENQLKDYNNLLNISRDQLQEGNMSMVDYLTLLRNYFDLEQKHITTLINYQLEINNYNYWNW